MTLSLSQNSFLFLFRQKSLQMLLPGLFFVTFSLAQDNERIMTQEEFTQMLLGNTIIGEWAGSPYKQFFDRGGNTIYIGDDGNRSQGYWRIREDGYYCSTWPPGQIENCYKVTLLGEELLWYSGENQYPSHVVEGNQLKP
jgi:hypothetical protein